MRTFEVYETRFSKSTWLTSPLPPSPLPKKKCIFYFAILDRN